MRLKSLFLALAVILAPLGASAQTAGTAKAPDAITTPADAPATTIETAATPAVARTAPTPGIGQPVDGGMDLQPTVTAIGDEARWMNNVLLLPIMAGVSLVVFGLLAYAIITFRRREGREPAKFSHNTTVEVIWTAIPALILVVIAVPSFQLLAAQYDPPKPDLTVKAIGHQWYWEYQYPDQGDFGFDSVMLADADADKQGVPRKLDVDNRLVVPAGATVKVLVTASDVLHSWAMPAFWVKMDAVPGRINETWFKTDRPGVYYGQCSELCGTKHAFMPITVEVLPPAQFKAWVAAKQAENGITPPATTTAAALPAAPPATAAPTLAAPAAATPPTAAGGTGVATEVRPVEPEASPGLGASTGRNAGTTDTN